MFFAEYFSCNFGYSHALDLCGMRQDLADDKADWVLHAGPTPTDLTGPLTGHTTATDTDGYLYLEATYGLHQDTAR